MPAHTVLAPVASRADELSWRVAWQQVLAGAAVRPMAGLDDVPGVAAAFGRPASIGQAEQVQLGRARVAGWLSDPHAFAGNAEGRSYTLRVGPGGARVSCHDQVRRERALQADSDRARRDATIRAGYIVSGTSVQLGWDHDGFSTSDVVSLDLAVLDRAGARVVTEWSSKSRVRMVEKLANLDYAGLEQDGCVAGMVTLTYPGRWLDVAGSGSVVKGHLDALKERWRRAFGFAVTGFWKLEFQRRGAPHVHALVPVPALAPSPFCEAHQKAEHCRCWTFEEWLAWSWADIVDAGGVEFVKHLRAGTGVDFHAATRYSDPARLAVYFLGHSVKSHDGKEYQHRVPDAWAAPGCGPGRFWGVWGLVSATAVVELDGPEFFVVRRVLRGVLASRDRTVARRAPVTSDGQLGRVYRVPRADLRRRSRRTLGFTGSMTGGFVLVNDGLALALDIARVLRARAGSRTERGGAYPPPGALP